MSKDYPDEIAMAAESLDESRRVSFVSAFGWMAISVIGRQTGVFPELSSTVHSLLANVAPVVLLFAWVILSTVIKAYIVTDYELNSTEGTDSNHSTEAP